MGAGSGAYVRNAGGGLEVAEALDAAADELAAGFGPTPASGLGTSGGFTAAGELGAAGEVEAGDEFATANGLATGAASAGDAVLAAAGRLGAGGASRSDSSTLTAAPHEPQNFASARTNVAHRGHAFISNSDRRRGRLVRSCPQPAQRCAPTTSRAPQDGQ